MTQEYIMYKSIKNSNKAFVELGKVDDGLYEEHVELMEKRLKYVNSINIDTFKIYYNRLEVFFRLFK